MAPALVQENPYAPPTKIAAQRFVSNSDLVKVVNQFREQSRAVGVLWVFLGALFLVLASSDFARKFDLSNVLFLLFGFAFSAVGFGVFKRRRNSFLASVVLAFLLLLYGLASLLACLTLPLTLLVIFQSHRLRYFAKIIDRHSLPLNITPQELQALSQDAIPLS